MKCISSLIIFIAFAAIIISCKKEKAPSENVLYGTWIKGSNAGDTLQFLRRNDKNILQYNISFNAVMPAFKEMEYSYQNGKLNVKLYSPIIQDFYPINSFTWKQVGNEFEIRGIELFSILSSTEVRFTYRKL